METKKRYFVLTLPLRVEGWQADILDRRLRVNRDIYNAMLKKAYGRYLQMTQTKAWRRMEEGSEDLYQQRAALIERYRLRKYDLTKDAARYRQAFRENTDSPICQNLAENVWQAIDRLAAGRGWQVHFKGPNGLNDLSGKTNRSSILYRDGAVKWKGLRLPAVSRGNAYEREALQHEIRYCRIKRREIRGKSRYYVDLVLEGCAPLKHPENLGVQGDVSLRLYPDRRGRWRLGDLQLSPTGFQDRKLEREKQKMLGFLYRSRKAMNPQNYTENGKIRAGAFEWTYARHYIRERSRYRELCRRQRERRRQYQCRLADGLLAQGDRFYIEELYFSQMKRRTFHTGPGRPRRYGRSVEMSAPGSFLEILKRKCVQYKKRYESYRVEDTQDGLEARLA